MYYANYESDHVMRCTTKMVKYRMKNIFGNIEAVFFKLGTRNVHHTQNKMTPVVVLPSQHFCCWSLIKTEIPRFCLDQRPLIYSSQSTDESWENIVTMSVLNRNICPTLGADNEDIWILTERDWNQESIHGNNVTGVIWFLLWCTLLAPSLKNTALTFPEIFFIQYFTNFSCTPQDIITFPISKFQTH